MSRLFKIGLFVLITSVGVVAYVMRTADHLDAKKTYTVDAYMEDASGILKDTNVRMAGVTVGKVRSIQLEKGKARLTLEINHDVQLYEDARIEKKLDSMLGSSSLAIYPGVRDGHPLRAGGIITNSKSEDALTQIAGEATGLVKDLRKFLNEDGGLQSLQEILQSTRSALADLAVITKQIRGTAQGDDIAPIVTILRNTAGITEKLDRILAKNDQNINESLAGIRESIAKLNASLENIAGITGKIKSGEGNLGMLVNDDKLYDQVVSITTDLKSFLGSTAGLNLDVAFQSDYLNKQKEFRNQYGIRLTPQDKDKFYLLGLVDTPRMYENTRVVNTTVTGSPGGGAPSGIYTTTETERRQKLLVNAQIARRFFDMFTLRGGAIESSGGAGLDFQPIDKISLSAEIFDFSQEKKPFLRAFANIYPFFNPSLSNPLNWIYVGGGVDNILLKEYREVFFNVGLRFTDNDLKGIASMGSGISGIAK